MVDNWTKNALSSPTAQSLRCQQQNIDHSSKLQITKLTWNLNGSSSSLIPYVESVRTSKLLRCQNDGQPSKVHLYPEEGWAQSATSSYWLISIPWWNKSKCKIVEVSGTRRNSAYAKLVESGSGTVYLVGSFKSGPEPDFKLSLTSHVSLADFNLGYQMTGTLERGTLGHLQVTHFAVLRRYE